MTRTITEADLEAASFQAAALPHNDPDYYADLEELERRRQAAANEVVGVHIIEGRDPHVEVRVASPRNKSRLRSTACALGELLEAPVVHHPDPRPGRGDGNDVGDYRSKPAHAFYGTRHDKRR